MSGTGGGSSQAVAYFDFEDCVEYTADGRSILHASHLWKCCRCQNRYLPQEHMCTLWGCRHLRCGRCKWRLRRRYRR
ncbi:hypothetical protein GGS23DRAFT_544696 [Durotheca rogersii]|uniref:uncharacterized protein n=1 Tax=Durotheca rogersii TaxID=419775 RepID=UPI00221E73C6|nr:uncharacterized protein GGS23DRAFT_544696 [Durotheca rogersii]KAI5868261.1 hypothetical protein GGS23DRAFT_544696 [Durotheca rogersii]